MRTLTLAAPQRRPASAPGSRGRCSPTASPAASTQTCSPAGPGEPCPQPARVSWPGTRGTGLTRDRGRLGRPLRRPRARLPGAASPQPRSARARRPGARTPPGCPGSAASGLTRPGTGRRCRARPGCGRTSARSRAAEPAGAERAAGGRRARGHRLCTCSLARPGDSGRPPPGPRGACAAALWPPVGGVSACGGRRPPPALARQTEPLRALAQQGRGHPLPCTYPHAHTAPLAVIHTPGECMALTPRHTYTQAHWAPPHPGARGHTRIPTHRADAHCLIQTHRTTAPQTSHTRALSHMLRNSRGHCDRHTCTLPHGW